MKDKVKYMDEYLVRISRDQALVLFELLSRLVAIDNFPLEHDSEMTVLNSILCSLEEELTEPLGKNYLELLKLARERLQQ